MDENGLGDVIRGQCQTVIFFRNPQANESDYATWNLSPREMNFILGKEFTDRKYAILVSRPAIHESVILDVDLSGLGPYLKIYSSGNKNVLLAEKLQRELSDTDLIVQEYLKRAWKENWCRNCKVRRADMKTPERIGGLWWGAMNGYRATHSVDLKELAFKIQNLF